ncbi:MAG: hypothetical protein ACR2OI_10235 [Acidimicrobiia bacterium]
MADDPVEEERSSAVFWIVVAATALYLGVRLLQGLAWVVRQVA